MYLQTMHCQKRKANSVLEEHVVLWSRSHSDKSIAQSQVVSLPHRPIKLPKKASLKLATWKTCYKDLKR